MATASATERFQGKYLSLTSFKRDGTPVATPVWFVAENGHLLVETDADSYKVKRIRRNPHVRIALCDARGRLRGPSVDGEAEILPESDRGRVERLVRQKYRIDQFTVYPLYRLVMRLRGHGSRSHEPPVLLAITPEPNGSCAESLLHGGSEVGGLMRSTIDSSKPSVSGFVAPGFEEVRAEFERNFEERGEIGAAVAAYWRGEKVVDLWGGRRTPAGVEPWEEDTLIVFMSSTKGLAAMTLALANSRGWLDYDAPVARYWPEFAQNGKAEVTVRQLLGHAAGLVLLDQELRIADMRDLDAVARVLARQKPAWPPGTRHGYHTMSLGLYMQELIRHVDPEQRTLGRFFHEEIAVPLGLELYIGLPAEIPDERLATVKTLSIRRALAALPRTPPAMLKKYFQPRSTIRRSFLFSDLAWNDRRTLEVELPAGNGVGTARAMARAYSAFAEGGAELGITPETFARITALPPTDHPDDEVIGIPTYFSLGFLRPGPEVWFGSSARAFCAPGAGGSFAFADPDAHLGYAYVMNKLDFYYNDDPREKPLRDAVHRAIRRADASPIRAGAPERERVHEGGRRGAVR